MKKCVLALALLPLLFGGCTHWQTPSVSFDFDNFISIDNGGVEFGVPVKIYIPFPGSGGKKVDPVETVIGYYVMPQPVPPIYIEPFPPIEWEWNPIDLDMENLEIHSGTETISVQGGDYETPYEIETDGIAAATIKRTKPDAKNSL